MYSLIAPTEDFIKIERSELNADVVAGSNVSLTLKNNSGMAQNTFIVIGTEGAEICELEQINAAVSGNTDVQVAILKFNHKKGEPITVFRYDKRKFYGALTETGTYVELTSDGSPVNIEVDNMQGTRLEYTGAEGYTYFKATYYNSTTTDETTEDDADAVLADESKRYASIFAIRKHAGLAENPFIDDGRIEVKRKQAESEINSAIFSRYSLPLSEIPDLIKRICILLGAGYIDYEEMGVDGEGKKWLGEARALLKAVRDGKQVLLDSDSAELTRAGSTVSRLKGYPDNTIEDGDDDFTKFSMGDKF